MQIVDEKERVEDAVERPGNMGRHGPEHQGNQHGVAPDEPQALGDLASDGGREGTRRVGRLGAADEH